MILKGQTTLSWYSYIVALLLGCTKLSVYLFLIFTNIYPACVTPFSLTLVARVGNGIATNQLMKMVGGAIAPGRPVANLYVCTWMMSFIIPNDDDIPVYHVES